MIRKLPKYEELSAALPVKSDIKYTGIMLGNTGSGKSSIGRRAEGFKFYNKHIPNRGLKYFKVSIRLNDSTQRIVTLDLSEVED